MKLRDLEARLVRYESRPDGEYQIDVASLSEAQGVVFLCPLCYQHNDGSVGTHGVAVTFTDRGVTDAQGSHGTNGNPTRWKVEGGTTLDDLTLSPSILLEGGPHGAPDGCGWHGFVRNGEATLS